MKKRFGNGIIKSAKTKQNPFLWLTPVLLAIIAAAIIPLNLFLIQMPEQTAIVISCGILAAAVIMLIKLKRKTAGKIVISLFCLLGIALSLFGSYCNPYWNSITFYSDNDLWYCKEYDRELTYAQAKADLDYAMKYLKKLHPAFYEGIPTEIQRRYDDAVSALEHADKITVNKAAQEIQSMCFLLGDAHTHITMNYTDERYMKYIYGHREAGDILKGINGMTWEQLLDTSSFCHDKVSYEVKDYGTERLLRYVNTLQGLDYLGISVKNGVTYNYETADGETIDRKVTAADFITYEEYVKFNNIDNRIDEEYNFVSYEINKEKNAAVLTLDECNYNGEYINTLKKMFTEIKEQGITNAAVDLRHNGGGNSLAANEFLRYIDVDSYKEWACDWRLGWFMFNIPQTETQNSKYEDLLFKGNLYLLTSTSTFSSAMCFAQYVKDNGIGTIIGEPSGNAPDSYGDISAFKLPNSGAVIQISTKKWDRIDNIEGLIEPDIPCEEWEALDYFYKECEKN